MIHSFSSIDCYHNVCPRQMYERYIAKSVPYVETPEMKAGIDDHKALQRRLQDDAPLPEHLKACEPVCAAIDARGIPFVEVKMGVDRNLGPTGFWDGDAWIRGALDVNLMAPGFTGAFILDWKTGKNREAGKEPLQLMLSAGYVFAYYEECQSITAANVYTKTGQMGTAHTWKRSELTDIWRTIVPMVHEIENARTFPEKPSGLCGWCPVKACKHNRS